MTASEELRRMLDELGVEWWPLSGDMTECVVDDVRIKYRQVGRGLIVSTCTEGTMKPEQAIAATLGRGECHKLPASGEKTCIVRHNSTHLTMEFGYWRCSECGCECFEGARYCMGCGARVVDA